MSCGLLNVWVVVLLWVRKRRRQRCRNPKLHSVFDDPPWLWWRKRWFCHKANLTISAPLIGCRRLITWLSLSKPPDSRVDEFGTIAAHFSNDSRKSKVKSLLLLSKFVTCFVDVVVLSKWQSFFDLTKDSSNEFRRTMSRVVDVSSK